MSSNKNKKNETEKRFDLTLHPDVKKSVVVVVCIAFAILFILAANNQAGPAGKWFYGFFQKLFGWGYYLLPTAAFMLAFAFIAPDSKKFWGTTLLGVLFFIISGLGFMDIISPESGGLTGAMIGSLEQPFGTPASLVITFATLIASFLVTLNKPFSISLPKWKGKANEPRINMPMATVAVEEDLATNDTATQRHMTQRHLTSDKQQATDDEGKETILEEIKIASSAPVAVASAPKPIRNYVPPPLSLLSSSVEQPTIGDLRANANIIKRTLDSFGIPVEMGEINVGPTVTRYTLKPAEGVKLSRITALNQDLALALAAHPIRIEAPIPGKSLVGIEVPNKSAAVVRLGSLLLYPEFQKADPLSFALGRNVSGEPVFADIAKMPHLLVAGATGSGKSIMIHSLLLSLLYKNSPAMLRFIMIDPKRVELSIYNNLPHLLAPVIIENKKAIGALRWLIDEMDRRYTLLLEAGARDIKSYNKGKDKLPYFVVVIDELADLMTSYGKEVEGSIIRLAQMSRATGIHLVVSTQRPSVEVITGLIKANITSRIALQVASNVDSRTILDTSGAEKLLGNGDALFTSAELSKPKRIQGGYVTEEEIKKVTNFIKENNDAFADDDTVNFPSKTEKDSNTAIPINFGDYDKDDDDDLYNEAVETVKMAGKASASLLQRRLKVGYARAARLLDMMEERGIIGPGDGARPREILQ